MDVVIYFQKCRAEQQTTPQCLWRRLNVQIQIFFLAQIHQNAPRRLSLNSLYTTRLQEIMVVLFIILDWILFWWIQLPWFRASVSQRKLAIACGKIKDTKRPEGVLRRACVHRDDKNTNVIQWFILMNLYITFFPCGPVWESWIKPNIQTRQWQRHDDLGIYIARD